MTALTRVSALALTIALVACDDGGTAAVDAGPDATIPAGACTPDPALLSPPRVCVADPDCPCGAHCALGECVAACQSDADCADGVTCDPAFGRCGAPAIDAPGGTLALDRTRVGALTPDAAVAVHMRAVGAALGPVRVAATAPVEVACADGDFAATCTFADLRPADGPVRLRLRTTAPPGPAPIAADVTLHAGAGRRVLSVRLAAARAPRTINRAGAYTGTARLIAAGVGDALALPTELARLSVPVRVWLVADPDADDRLPGRFESDGGLVFGGPLPGALRRDGDTWDGAVDPHPFVAVRPDAATQHAIADGAISDVAWRVDGLAFGYEARVEGLATDPIRLRWQIELIRQGDVPDDVVVPQPPVLPERTPTADAAAQPWAIEDPTQLVGETTADRVGAALCPAIAEGEASGFQPALATDAEGAVLAGGDLACAADRTRGSAAFPVLYATRVDVQDTLEACATDLTTPDGATCVHRQRVLTAVAEALASARAGLPDRAGAALAQRTLQQWLTVHGVLARDVDRAAQIERLLGDAPAGGTDLSLRQALEASLDGWDSVLHPRVATGLLALDADALAQPDYRRALFPDGVEGLDPDAPPQTHPQAVGLPVALLDLWTAQLRAFTRVVRDAQAGLSQFDAVEALYGRLARRGALVIALATHLNANAGEVPWADQWDLARQATGAATAEAQRAIADLRAGRNPLGVDDIDLPIYRVGDQVADGARFSALSDSLIGRPGDARPVVPSLIERARARLTEARDAFVDARDRDLSVEQLGRARERRLMDINRQYGEQIIGLCLNPEWVAFDILEQWDQIDPDTCFLDTTLEPSCVPTAQSAAAVVSSAEIAYDICLVAGLRDAIGGGVATGSDVADAMIEAVGPALVAEGAERSFRRLQVTAVEPGEAPDDVAVEFTHDGQSYRVNRADLSALFLDLPPDLPADVLPNIWRMCGHRRQVALDARPGADPATCALADECTAGAACFEGACRRDVLVEPSSRPECYRGVLGELALAVEAARKEVEAARAELDEFSASFDIAIRGCLIQQAGFEAAESLTRQHNIVMGALGGAKLAAQLVLYGIEAAADAASITDGTSINIGAVINATAVAPKSAIAGLDLAMDVAQREYELARDIIENATTIKLCFNDAQYHLIGARAAALRIQQATLQATRQLVEFNNLKVTLAGLLLEGHLSLEAERARTLHPLDIDFWIDEAFTGWFRLMRQARRATYLAVLAVEYEFQLSLDLRATVLQAEHPDDLEAVLDALRGRVATGTINGAAPTTLVEVVSLRDHLLRFAEPTDARPGWRRLPPAERFGRWLADPRFAVHDPVDGRWLGQEVPFTLLPERGAAADGLGVGLLTGTDCAERLWSVNASLVGPVVEGDASTFARVVLRQRNTFHSQRCDGRDALQTAATRPSRNLFLDPVAYDPVEQPPGGLGEDTGFTSARVQARIGVTRAELEDEAFAQGASEELAGRGLYGDYRLFIPASSLSDLALEDVEDVLLRIDYVSVARGR